MDQVSKIKENLEESEAVQTQIERIFEEDEMTLKRVERNWTERKLLRQKGIFFLKDIVGPLELDSPKVIKRARDLEAAGKSCWRVMGIRKVWNHWAVRMKVFAPYYRKHLKSRVTPINTEWDSNVLLEQKGLFLLSEVCELIPFSTYQIRYQAMQNPRAVEEYGIWKDLELNRLVVNMEVFAEWIKDLWRGNFNRN